MGNMGCIYGSNGVYLWVKWGVFMDQMGYVDVGTSSQTDLSSISADSFSIPVLFGAGVE